MDSAGTAYPATGASAAARAGSRTRSDSRSSSGANARADSVARAGSGSRTGSSARCSGCATYRPGCAAHARTGSCSRTGPRPGSRVCGGSRSDPSASAGSRADTRSGGPGPGARRCPERTAERTAERRRRVVGHPEHHRQPERGRQCLARPTTSTDGSRRGARGPFWSRSSRPPSELLARQPPRKEGSPAHENTADTNPSARLRPGNKSAQQKGCPSRGAGGGAARRPHPPCGPERLRPGLRHHHRGHGLRLHHHGGLRTGGNDHNRDQRPPRPR